VLHDYNAALRDLISTLESSGIRYALGGAAAVAVWAIPRATADIDITVWGPPADATQLLAKLAGLGVEMVPECALREATEQGVVYARWQGIRLDIFFPSIPFYDAVLRDRVRLDLPELGGTWVLSAESLTIFKLLFRRPKDLRDIAAIVALNDTLDRAYIRKTLIELVGAADVRVNDWDEIALERRPT
jgi:hypothetical protein